MRSLTICLIFIFFSVIGTAQIIYTDIIPDDSLTLTGDYYNLDLNNDGTTDFILHRINVIVNCLSTCGFLVVPRIVISPTDTGNQVLTYPMNGIDVTRLNSNDAIGQQSQLWSNDTNSLIHSPITHCLAPFSQQCVF